MVDWTSMDNTWSNTALQRWPNTLQKDSRRSFVTSHLISAASFLFSLSRTEKEKCKGIGGEEKSGLPSVPPCAPVMKLKNMQEEDLSDPRAQCLTVVVPSWGESHEGGWCHTPLYSFLKRGRDGVWKEIATILPVQNVLLLLAESKQL